MLLLLFICIVCKTDVTKFLRVSKKGDLSDQLDSGQQAKGHTAPNLRQFDVVLRQYVEYQISTNFQVISTYFFDVISLIEISTLFPRTFFDVISMVEKPALFPRAFFDVEISTVFLLYFFRHNFDGPRIHFVCTYLFRRNFDGKVLASFFLSCKVMETFK